MTSYYTEMKWLMEDNNKISLEQNIDGHNHKIVGGNIIQGDAHFHFHSSSSGTGGNVSASAASSVEGHGGILGSVSSFLSKFSPWTSDGKKE